MKELKLRDHWRTPRDLFEQAELNLSLTFYFDAAADVSNHLCNKWFGPGSPIAEDALAINWYETAIAECVPPIFFLNPPYTFNDAFIRKASEECKKGCTIVCLLQVAPETRAWMECIWNDWDYGNSGWTSETFSWVEVIWLKGRVAYDPPPGVKKSTPRHASCIVVFDGIKYLGEGNKIVRDDRQTVLTQAYKILYDVLNRRDVPAEGEIQTPEEPA